MKVRLLRLTTTALMIALSVVLTRIASLRVAIGGIEAVRIGIGSLPKVLAGALMGPLAGGTVGALEDLIGYFINPIGPYMPHFTFASALAGFIPGLLLMSRRDASPSIWRIFFAVTVGQVVVSLGVTPYFLLTLFKIPLAASLPPRALGAVLDIAIYVPFIHLMFRNLQKSGILRTLRGVGQ